MSNARIILSRWWLLGFVGLVVISVAFGSGYKLAELKYRQESSSQASESEKIPTHVEKNEGLIVQEKPKSQEPDIEQLRLESQIRDLRLRYDSCRERLRQVMDDRPRLPNRNVDSRTVLEHTKVEKQWEREEESCLNKPQ